MENKLKLSNKMVTIENKHVVVSANPDVVQNTVDELEKLGAKIGAVLDFNSVIDGKPQVIIHYQIKS